MKPTDVRADRSADERDLRLFDYWLYGLVKSASELGTTDLVLRRIEEAAVSKFFEHARPDLRGARTAAGIIRRYLQAVDRAGLMDRRDVTFREDSERIRIRVGPLCPYRTVCNWVNAELPLHRCFRAISLSEVIRRCTSHRYDGTLDRFEIPCEVTLTRSRVEED